MQSLSWPQGLGQVSAQKPLSSVLALPLALPGWPAPLSPLQAAVTKAKPQIKSQEEPRISAKPFSIGLEEKSAPPKPTRRRDHARISGRGTSGLPRLHRCAMRASHRVDCCGAAAQSDAAVDTWHWIMAAVVTAVSAWIQGSVGFGYALVSAPLLALLTPELVPGPVMVSSFVVSAAAGWRERASTDRRGVVLALIGRVPGALLAGAVVSMLSVPTLNLVFGVLVLLAVAMSVSGVRVALSSATLLVTGFVSGVMGTMTSIGGPPMAMLYQHAEGPTLRATLNTYFALGTLISLPVLALIGHFGSRELVNGSLLLPAAALGFAFSGLTRQWLDRGYTRGAVLTVASASALGVVLKALLR
jgi:uncharacterized membrane protein YfcA